MTAPAGSRKLARNRPAPAQKPELRWIKLTQLYVPSEYQRPAKNATSLANINYIKTNFNWASCGALIVCELAKAKPPQYAIIDGQHRFRAAEGHGKITELPCIVISPREAQEQAKHFVEVNSKRIKLHGLHEYRAAIVAGEPTACMIDAILKKAKNCRARNTRWATRSVRHGPDSGHQDLGKDDRFVQREANPMGDDDHLRSLR